MARAGYKVFDSDMHCVEPPDLWERYIDPQYRARAPRSSEFAFRNAVVYMELEQRLMPWFDPRGPEGRPLPAVLPAPQLRAAVRQAMEQRPEARSLEAFQQARFGDFSRRGWSADTQLEAMDVEGVDVTVVFPTSGLLALAVDELEPAFAGAVARAYNDWLSDYVKRAPGRLLGAAMVAPHSVEEAVRETHRAVEELGFRAIFLRPNPVQGRQWYDPAYDALWEACTALGVPVVFHEGVGSHLPQAGRRFGSNIFLRHVACHSMEMMYAAMAFCGGGVLARHPGLKVGLFEGNCSWVPWLLHRMDEHWEIELGVTHQQLPEPPSHYFRRQCVVSVEADEDFVTHVVQHMGADNIVFSTDWPHPDSRYPRAVERFLEIPLEESARRKILSENCARFYGWRFEREA
ncbi:amidohydrolase family protein [Hyalangium sp.]|uniref:amidohydrolase family protein n=1 Tax=Hyalangium sp. TaxID=2028555 RepID=UPI002D735D24|nr:amidohydrolase family protein [Hyalangium sp.]HYH98145.1 amidohydrolase family protein [Hyalangium sp.]